MGRRPSRRRTLRAIGALAGAGLAGCPATPSDVGDTPSGRRKNMVRAMRA